jgi:hypothetical protein
VAEPVVPDRVLIAGDMGHQRDGWFSASYIHLR